MPDMLVKLYELSPLAPPLEALKATGVTIRTAMAYEKHHVVAWVQRSFSQGWASECDVTFSRQPITCCIAIEHGHIIGFACYESTWKNFFGPMGVAEHARGRGIGAALLLACLHAMAALGYAYAIIGDAGPPDFYTRTVGAIPIADSTPGAYPAWLQAPRPDLRDLPNLDI
jgi:GNAT superfamily N-acetyltransferase